MSGSKDVWLPVCIVCLVLPFWDIFIFCLRHQVTQCELRSISTTTAHAMVKQQSIQFSIPLLIIPFQPTPSII